MSWFKQPEPDEPTGLTVTSEGQLYGHAALWGTCHTGKPGRCVTPPRSRSGYAYFQTGITELQEGGAVRTGPLSPLAPDTHLSRRLQNPPRSTTTTPGRSSRT